MDDDDCPECGALHGDHLFSCSQDERNWDDELDDDEDDDGDGW